MTYESTRNSSVMHRMGGFVALPPLSREDQWHIREAGACLHQLWPSAKPGHEQQVATLALALADRCHLLPTEVERHTLIWGATLHDVGKTDVPARILRKPGSLTADERREVQEHPARGERLLHRRRPDLSWQVRSIVLHHHERYDGTGFPFGLSGGTVPALARVVKIADAFDTLTSDRPYRSAWGAGETLDFMESQAGTQFDPVIVYALRQVLNPVPGISLSWPQTTPGL